MLKSYKELTVWKKAMNLVTAVYDLTDSLPDQEQYNLVNHMRKSAISIPSNIAEGYKRDSTGDYRRFINIAQASASELETQTLLIKRLYSDNSTEKVLQLVTEVQKMLFSLREKLDSDDTS